jgi:hypothetical protein
MSGIVSGPEKVDLNGEEGYAMTFTLQAKSGKVSQAQWQEIRKRLEELARLLGMKLS